jgi:thiol-disulfide isomerase/thioredoxin
MAAPAPAPAPAKHAPPVEVVSIHRSPGATLTQLFHEQLAVADSRGQKPVVMFTADWCTPCRTIKEALTSNPIVQSRTRGGRFLLIDVDEWRGPAQRLIEGADASKLPLLVAVDGQGVARTMAHGSRIGLLDPQTTGENLARLMNGQEIVPPSYQDDPERRRALAVADSKRLKHLVADRVPVLLEVSERTPLSGGGERLRLDLTIHNNEAARRYWVLPTHGPLPKGVVEVPKLSGSRFALHIRAGFFTYATEPPTHVMAAGNWGKIVLRGYTIEVPAGTRELQVHKLNRVSVAGEKLNFTKKVPYELMIDDASKLVPGRTFAEPRTLELDVKKTYRFPI